MHTYAFLTDHGLAPEDVEAVLQELQVPHKGVQVFHYTRPRVVMVMTEIELDPQVVEDVRKVIAQIESEDPLPPNA